MRRNCYYEHPELHSANRAWTLEQMNAQLQDASTLSTPKVEEANVMEALIGDETEALEEPGQHEYSGCPEFDHPFELNIIMKDSMQVTDPYSVLGVILENPMDNVHRKTDVQRRWLLDSSATSYYMKDVHRFRTYTWLDHPVKIYTGKAPVWGLARGDVEIVMAIGKVVVRGVLLVPDLDVDADLLSVTALMAKGYSVTFAEGKADIHKDKKIWGTVSSAESDNAGGGGGLLYLEEYEDVQQYALAASCIDTQTLDTWHERLAHIQRRTIKDMIPNVTGLRIGEPTKIGEWNIDCPDCLKGSQHQQISRYPFKSATRPLERVSCDIAGKMRYPDCTWNY